MDLFSILVYFIVILIDNECLSFLLPFTRTVNNLLLHHFLQKVNPAKRNVMVVKNEMRLLKQKRNVLQI